MKIYRRWAAICLLFVFALFVSAQSVSEKLADRANQETPMIEDLRELCDTIGGRPTGSAACEKSIEWAAAKFKEIGVDSVKTESFTVPNLWLAESAEAFCIAPEQFPVRLVSSPYSPSTASKDFITAKLVDAGEGRTEDFARLGEKAKGAIVLVRSNEMKTLEDLFVEYFRNKPLLENAKKAGAAVLLLQSTRPRGLLYRHPVTFGEKFAPLPVATVSREHAARLVRLVETGRDVQLRLKLANKTAGAYQSRNVVAEIRGSEKPSEVVLIGAHLDSWDLGTGANDNGVNSALVIDAARAIKQLGVKPRRTIRFVLFTGEEQGMWGSAGYVKTHAAELDNHTAVSIFDIGSGKITGFFLNGREELRGPVEKILSAVDSLGTFENPIDGIDGTDNFDFLLSGVPNLVANQDAAPYLPDYHAESDVFEMVDQAQARKNAAIAAVLTWGLADMPERLAARQSRQEVEKLLLDTKLDEQMKAFNQWEMWTSGTRGVNR